MRTIIILFVLLFVIVFGVVISQNYFKQNPLFTKTPTITINNQVFKLTVVKETKDLEAGLSGKDSLAQDSGMLFIFPKADFYSFWTKNMKFPIDIIFINGDKVVNIYKNAQPLKSNETPQIYKPSQSADKTLEINSGLSDKYNIKEGNQVKIENL